MYIIWAHPRITSLTAQVVQAIQKEGEKQKFNVSSLDLYRRNFNPVLNESDEPDWNNSEKKYSLEVHALFDELKNKDTIVVVFPVWWFSFPAMLKGYIDRVWNNGLAYGPGSKFAGKRIRWVALVGGSEEGFIKYGWKNNFTNYIKGFMNYLGIEDQKIDFLYNTLIMEEEVESHEKHYQQLFSQARNIVKDLIK